MTIAEVGWGRISITVLLGNTISALSLFLRTIWRNPLLILLFRCYSCHHYLRFAIWCHFNALLSVILILLFSPVSLMFLSPLSLVSAGGSLRLDTGSPICCPFGGWYHNVWNVCLAIDEICLAQLTILLKLFGSLVVTAWHKQPELVLD